MAIGGAHNLRDMGGYGTMDGRRVRTGMLYRAGVMNDLCEADAAALRALGIVAIYDLRGTFERQRKPTSWHVDAGIAYHSRDYELSVGDLDAILHGGEVSHELATEAIHSVYRTLPFEQAESYRGLFALLAAGRAPLLFNCSAGKDRTGVAAALILHLLGVSREDIARDYALTERAIERLIATFLKDPRHAALVDVPRERYLPLLRSDPVYLDVAFDEIERRCGSTDAYFTEVIGVDAGSKAAIRDLLLA